MPIPNSKSRTFWTILYVSFNVENQVGRNMLGRDNAKQKLLALKVQSNFFRKLNFVILFLYSFQQIMVLNQKLCRGFKQKLSCRLPIISLNYNWEKNGEKSAFVENRSPQMLPLNGQFFKMDKIRKISFFEWKYFCSYARLESYTTEVQFKTTI